jgi:hypothetical protein
METKKTPLDELNEKLKSIETNGIQADRQHLKRNMCAQFSDPMEFAREYVVNAYDASATVCHVSGKEDENSVTVIISDNGRGMNKQRVHDFLTIYRSRKDDTYIKAVGRHGIGKLSVAAIPGLIWYKVTTSTGTECWRFETDSLLDERPITLQRIEPVPPSGTTFEITFKKEVPLIKLLGKIHDILYQYVRHLPLTVRFYMPGKPDGEVSKPIQLIQGNWMYSPECLGQSYHVTIDGEPYEIVMGVGQACHEIYQNRVLISPKFNLFSYGMKEGKGIPNLMIRVDSEAFELPFGRHCLCNEEVLEDLSCEIREKILPVYFNSIAANFRFNTLSSSAETLRKIEEMACGLMQYMPYAPSWGNFPVFRLVEGKRLSLIELKEELNVKPTLFIEAEKNEGADYKAFSALVLAFEQPQGALDIIVREFGERVINLNGQDTVIELPVNDKKQLTEEEKQFEKYLVFQPKNVVMERLMGQEKPAASSKKGSFGSSEIEDYVGICEEAKTAEKDFSQINWRVNYLVERDGSTPCLRRKFLYRSGSVVLNLYHPEIREFVELASLNPNLSAHWAMAMCISDSKLLPHITPEAREDLMLIDAMARIDSGVIYKPSAVTDDPDFTRDMLDFLKNCINRPGKRN